jgi:hypothetical protein
LAELPPTGLACAPLLSNLGNWFALRFDHTGDDGDLAKAVASAESAHASLAPEHPNYATLSVNLALVLCRRQPNEIPHRAVKLTELAATHPRCRNGCGPEWSGAT